MLNSKSLCLMSLCCIFVVIMLIEMLLHLNLSFIYIPINHKKQILYTNKIVIVYDQYVLLLKIIICLEHNIPYNIKNLNELKLFLHLGFFILNIVLGIHEVYLLISNKFVYLESKLSILIRCIVNVSLVLFGVYIIISNFFNSYFFYFGIVNSCIIACSLCYVLASISVHKMKDENNKMGNLIYLIRESGSKDINKIMFTMVTKHKCTCQNPTCKVCDCISSDHTKLTISCEKLSCFFYDQIRKDCKNIFNGNYGETYFSFYLIFELYESFLSRKKNLIQIVYIYNKIKMLSHKNMRGFSIKNEKSKNMFTQLSINFFINLDVLYHQIIKTLSPNGREHYHNNSNNTPNGNSSSQNFNYLINIESVSQAIKYFIDRLLFFLNSKDKTPQELFILSHNFTTLRNKVDFNFLVSKENKLNYSCLIMAYIMEEIFNDKIGKNTYVTELIHSLDDLLDYKYNEDNIILTLFDVLNSNLLIKQCSKHLIHLKGSNFSKLFPKFLSSEGNSKLLRTLTQNEDNYFEFYYCHKDIATTEFFKMKFMGLPSLKNKLVNMIYVVCTFLIEKENFLIFKKHFNENAKHKILISLSENMSVYFKLSQLELNELISNNTYITLWDICKDDSTIIDRKKINNFFRNCLQKKDYRIEGKKRLVLILKETINNYEVYYVREKEKSTLTANFFTIVDEAKQTILTQCKEETNIDFKFQVTQTNISSSTLTGSVFSTYNRTIKAIKNEETLKYQKFFYFTYILISFNVIIVIVLMIFLYLQLSNNTYLKNTFIVITNYNDFQSYFYHTALSLFSLTCNADYLEQTECDNQFTIFCLEFSLAHGLTENELMNEYLAREMSYKSDIVISALKQWENDKYQVHSDALNELLNENFIFTVIEEVAHELSISNVKISFEEAIRRFVNTIYVIPTFETYLTSVIWTITYKNDNEIDLTNIKLGKPIKTDKNDPYLTEVQKYYYMMILNFQKYLKRMLNVSDILFEYYADKINVTSLQILIFIIIFWVLHILMMMLSILFVFRFKSLHMNFFIMIYKKLLNKTFLTYYFSKIEQLTILLELYQENPNKCLNNLYQLRQKEKTRLDQVKKLKKKQKGAVDIVDESLESAENSELIIERMDIETWSQLNINKNILNKMYSKTKITTFIYEIILVFTSYILFTLMFYFIIINSVSRLSLMNSYVKNNYDVSNQLYLNLALIQIMSLTNQTQEELQQYFNPEHSTPGRKYITDNIEELFNKINDVEKIENNQKSFKSLSDLLELTCESIYNDMNDPIISLVIEGFPQCEYKQLLIEYCKAYSNLQEYTNEKMTLKIITYKTSTMLNEFVDRTYETYAKISNSIKLYQIYTEILMIARPLRRYLYTYMGEVVIENILRNHNILMIVFLVCNFVYESILLYIIQFQIINNIIRNSKEIIIVAKAFECFI